MSNHNNQEAILIVLVAGIGDLVLASKSIRAIRNGHPEAEICLLTSTEAATIADNYHFLDKVWAFPIRELRDKNAHYFSILKIIRKLRNRKFDTIINLYRVSSYLGAVKMGLLFLALKAKVKIGHANKHFGIFLTKKVPAISFKDRHIVDAMMDIALLAGGKPDKQSIEVFCNNKSKERWSDLFEDITDENQGLLLGINPGGDRENRRWCAAKFAEVANELIETEKILNVILLGGIGEEHIAREIENNIEGGCINLSGKLSLNDLIFVISNLDLLITNDSGPMHIGAAFGIHIVAIFGPENPSLFHPYTEKDKYLIVTSKVSNTFESKLNYRGSRQLDQIAPKDVLDAAKKLIIR